MADFGGVMRFSYNGTPLVLRGKVTTEPASVKAEAITNQDNSVSRSLAPKGFGAEVTFEDSNPSSTTGVSAATPQPWDAILKGGSYNFSLIEDTTGIVHTWTNANLVGDVKVDRMNGEVTGLSIHGGSYNTTSAGA